MEQFDFLFYIPHKVLPIPGLDYHNSDEKKIYEPKGAKENVHNDELGLPNGQGISNASLRAQLSELEELYREVYPERSVSRAPPEKRGRSRTPRSKSRTSFQSPKPSPSRSIFKPSSKALTIPKRFTPMMRYQQQKYASKHYPVQGALRSVRHPHIEFTTTPYYDTYVKPTIAQMLGFQRKLRTSGYNVITSIPRYLPQFGFTERKSRSRSPSPGYGIRRKPIPAKISQFTTFGNYRQRRHFRK